MNILFDLDHTLFQTSLYKDDLFNVFLKSKASLDDIQNSYQKHIKKVKGNYNFKEHSKILKETSVNFDEKLAQQFLIDFESGNFKKYVKKEVFETLQKMKKSGIKIILLTKGAENIQKQKIKKSGLDKFFDKVIICQEDKSLVMKKMAFSEESLFVNDHLEETLALEKKFPNLKYFLLKRSDLKKNYSNLKTNIVLISSIKEIL